MAVKKKKRKGKRVGRPSTGRKCVTANISLRNQEQKDFLELFGYSKFVQKSVDDEYNRRLASAIIAGQKIEKTRKKGL